LSINMSKCKIKTKNFNLKQKVQNKKFSNYGLKRLDYKDQPFLKSNRSF